MNDDNWDQAEKTVSDGIKKGPAADLYLDLAEIRFHKGADGADYAALQAIALDKPRELPRAEYVLGMILAAGEDSGSCLPTLGSSWNWSRMRPRRNPSRREFAPWKRVNPPMKRMPGRHPALPLRTPPTPTANTPCPVD